MKEYVLSILKDHRLNPSSSRWIAFLGFAALVGLIWIGVGSDPKQHKQRSAWAAYYREESRVEDANDVDRYANDVDRYANNWRTRND